MDIGGTSHVLPAISVIVADGDSVAAAMRAGRRPVVLRLTPDGWTTDCDHGDGRSGVVHA